MGFSSCLKKFGVGFLVAMQVFSFMPTVSNATYDDIYNGGKKYYPFYDEVSLKADIIQDEDFYKPLAYLAHYMGFGWCGGTRAKYVGEDFDFKMIDNDTFELKAHYNSNDPYSSGYRAGERLKMTIDNVKFYMDGESLELGKSQIEDLKPLTSVTGYAKNRSDYEDSAVVDFTYNSSTSWSKTDNYSFSEKIGIANEYKFDVGIMGNKTTITAEFSATQGWNETDGETNSLVQHQQYVATVPGKHKRLIRLTVFKQDASTPYKINMYMTYDLTFDGFLRWGGNARNDHPTNRPWETFTFGNNNGLDAKEDILQQYLHRDINGYGKWDFDWMINEFGESNVRWVLSRICKTDFGSISEGKFKTSDGTFTDMDAYDAVPLTEDELINREARGEESDIILEDIENEDELDAQITDFELLNIEKDLKEAIIEKLRLEDEVDIKDEREELNFEKEDSIDEFKLQPILMQEEIRSDEEFISTDNELNK